MSLAEAGSRNGRSSPQATTSGRAKVRIEPAEPWPIVARGRTLPAPGPGSAVRPSTCPSTWAERPRTGRGRERPIRLACPGPPVFPGTMAPGGICTVGFCTKPGLKTSGAAGSSGVSLAGPSVSAPSTGRDVPSSFGAGGGAGSRPGFTQWSPGRRRPRAPPPTHSVMDVIQLRCWSSRGIVRLCWSLFEKGEPIGFAS